MKLKCMTLMAVVWLPLAVAAGEVRTQFLVSAVVTPRVALEPVAQPATFTVSGADLERGYVDVAASYRVRNNDPAGYLVRIAPRTALADGTVVTGLASSATVSDDVVEVVQPASLEPSRLELRFRVPLNRDLAPGEYPMPLAVSAATY